MVPPIPGPNADKIRTIPTAPLRFERQRSVVPNPQDEAVTTKILLSLPKADREAMIRFYLDGELTADIERDLGLSPGSLNRLKASVRARFDNERHGPPA
jgi:hypothetical protein